MRNAARLGLQATCAFLLMFAHATLSAASPLPAPWVNQDLGTVGVPGSASASGGVYTVSGAGADIWGSADAFQAVMQPISGDVQIIARVATIQNTNTYAKAGIMLRSALTAGSAHVILDVRPNGSTEFMMRSASGGATTWIASTTQPAPAWLKLTRTGNTVTGYASANGTTWTPVGSTTLSIPSAAYVGFAVTSHDTTKLNTSTFDNVAITGGGIVAAAPAIPAPWSNKDVGIVGVTGSTSYSNGVFTLKGAGADIWGSADAFQAVSQPLSGDVQLITRVTSVQNTNTYAKAGIMLRDSLAAGAAHVILDLRPNGSIEFMTRSTTNGQTTWLASTTQSAPVWLKLTRSGSTVTGSVSTNGTAWTDIGTTSITFGASPVGALLVTSHDTTQLNTATFDNVTAGALPVVVPPPSAPSSPSPVSGAAALMGTSTTLTWAASGATSYDVRFGTTNPPAQVASAQTAASYTASVAQGVTYYWQVVANNAGGSTAGPVWSFSTLVPPPPAPSVPSLPAPVSGTTGITSSMLPLAWTSTGATAYDVYFGSTNPPSLASSNLGVATYAVSGLSAGTPYYWQVVAKNAGGSTMGPVWSFATQVAAPAPPSSAAPTNGATGVDASSVTLTWTANGATSYDVLFGTTNPPSPVATGIATPSYSASTLQQGTPYYWQVVAKNAGGTTAGPVWSFTTLAPPPPPAPTVAGVPSQYSAITDRLTRTKPAVPVMGVAGSTILDPTFGSKIMRVTDGATRPGLLNRSFRVPSNAHLAAWNSSSSMFIVVSNDGTIIPYKFDASTMTASRIQATGGGNGGLTLTFYVEPQFSLVKPNIIYGVGGSNNRTISTYDFDTNTYSTLINLDTVVSGVTGYVGSIQTAGTSSETVLTFFGGGGQDSHFYALLAPVDGGPRKLINTLASTLNGVPTSTTLGFKIHAVQIDRSGRYVFIYPTSADLANGKSQVYLWDTQTDVITPFTQSMLDGGHDAAGYGVWINQDCCTSSSWDAAQWQYRSLATPTETRDLISPVLPTKEIYMADHTTWNNAQPDRMVPVISSTYRYGNNTAPWRAWDDEIIGVDPASGNVYRFAHHRSAVGSDSNPASPYFWYEPIANISPDGRWVLFTSNWEKTLGTDSSEGTARQDVFLVQLTPLQ